ncbi:MAG: diaminopimelate epimerase [Bacillota bacterium]|nr:diaminopimelate epimerase [Bacillota bacterium]
MTLKVLKCHGSGNDFILIDEMAGNYSFTEEERKNIAAALCDREKAVGADGILFVLASRCCDGRMRIFNADGSEPEMCGNGLRCVGRYVLEKLNRNVVTIETMKAQYEVKKAEELYEGVNTIEIIIESLTFGVSDLPLNYPEDRLFFGKLEELSPVLDFSAVSVTNPHLVAVVEEINEEQLVSVGTKANSTTSLLPKGVNVNFVKVIDEQNLYVKTYERGVGLTKACGTGMTASTVVACMAGKCPLGREINIFNDGGMIRCIVNRKEDGKYYVQFIGNATYVFKAEIDMKDIKESLDASIDYKPFEAETRQYENMFGYTREVIENLTK